MAKTRALVVISCCLASMCLVLNSLGIYLLSQIKTNNMNQIMILINLGVAEILIAIGWLAEDVASMYGYSINDRLMQVVWGVRAGAYCFWFTCMCIMSIDRFLGCHFPLKHLILSSKKNIHRLMLCVWMLCATNSIFLICFDTRVLFDIYNSTVWFIFSSISVLTFVLTYTSIAVYMLKRRGVKRKSETAGRCVLKSNQQFVTVVTLILMSYVVFEVCPTTVTMVYFQTDERIPHTLSNIIDMSYIVAIFVDPLIYIFLQSRVRKLLVSKLGCRRIKPYKYPQGIFPIQPASRKTGRGLSWSVSNSSVIGICNRSAMAVVETEVNDTRL